MSATVLHVISGKRSLSSVLSVSWGVCVFLFRSAHIAFWRLALWLSRKWLPGIPTAMAASRHLANLLFEAWELWGKAASKQRISHITLQQGPLVGKTWT
jgi:hypothetical protein